MKFIYSSFPVLFIFPGILRINELPQASVLKREAKCKAIDIKMFGPETQTVPFELSSAVDYGQPV